MKSFLAISLLLCAVAIAQETPAPAQSAAPNGQERQPGQRGEMRFNGTAGSITAIKGDTITLKAITGNEAKVKVSDKTEYRKDQNPAKLADFKVGDMIGVRGEQASDGTWNAQMVVSRTGGMQIMGGPGGGMQQMREGLGKVFVVGKVKEINGTKLTIERVDNQTQVIEVDENTSFRKQGESITLGDIKAGDTVFARGQVKDGAFVAATLSLVDPSQMQMRTQTATAPK